MLTVNNIIRSVYRASPSSDIDKFNILSIGPNNEKYLSLLAQTEHKFYILPENPWNELIENKPSNIQDITLLLDDLDFIICYNRAEQYEHAQYWSKQLHVPIILVDMCSANLIRPQHLLEGVSVTNRELLNKQPALRVSCTEYIQESWSNTKSIVIPIGIDTNKFKANKPENEVYVAIDNNTVQQIGNVIAGHIGNNYQVIPTDHDNLNDISLNKAKYFINTNKSITVKTLEAMAAGAIVISLRTPDSEKYIDNYKTGVLIDRIENIMMVLDTFEGPDIELAKEISTNARQKIIDEHSMESFLSKWHQAFNIVRSTFYVPEI
jgi:hypothetical protein